MDSKRKKSKDEDDIMSWASDEEVKPSKKTINKPKPKTDWSEDERIVCDAIIDYDDSEDEKETKKSQPLASYITDESWKEALQEEFKKQYWKDLEYTLQVKRMQETVYPEEDNVFKALNMCPLSKIEKGGVVILDPYHDGNAMGLAFSVPTGRKINPSLKNIFKEIASDVKQCVGRDDGNLEGWASQGVLLLNTVLTVEKGKANSHKDIGWLKFTDAVISIINQKAKNVVFMLWGGPAKDKAPKISKMKHHILQAAHPSPLAGGKFADCKHFSKCNTFLQEKGRKSIDWDM